MSIDQTDKIDFISTSLDDKIHLTISDHLEWDKEGEHVLLLQKKINAYLHFIEEGQIFDDYPRAKNKQIVISVKMKYNPNEFALKFLNRCKEQISQFNIEFVWEVSNPSN